jgi:hypothetical protein
MRSMVEETGRRSAACMRTIGRRPFFQSDTFCCVSPLYRPSGGPPAPLSAGEDERCVIHRRLC